MTPLTDDEAALICHVMMFGSEGYPVERRGRGWIVRDWRTVKGPPVVYKTKREAVAQFEAWYRLACDRWRYMKVRNTNLIMTAAGIRELDKE